MYLKIDGRTIDALPGETLLNLVNKLDLNTVSFADRPLAAKIAGEVFTLNYVPVRKNDTQTDRSSIRRAMAASNGEVRLLRYHDEAGRAVYLRTLYYVVFLALRRLWPDAVAKMNCAVGASVYISVSNCPEFSIYRLKDKMWQLIHMDIPLIRSRISLQKAIDRFAADHQPDKARLLQWRQAEYFDLYIHEDYGEYFYGEMAPSTGYLSVWDIQPASRGFYLIYPDEQNPEHTADFKDSPNYFDVCAEGERWGSLMQCQTVADLNELTNSGQIRELIRINEALHEKRYSQIADMICARGTKAVLLAGPSSSGKTTSANRLATQLRVHGKRPVLMSLDDYYLDRHLILPGPDGKLDLEHINTIDTDLFRQDLKRLLSGEQVELPHFNFITGMREWHGRKLQLAPDSVVVVEGLHGLNPVLIPENVDPNLIFRLYISPLLPLNLDYHNRIPSSYLRLLRRIVRDYETRGSSVEQTLSMWDSVRAGEKRWIFPYQEQADVIFNSSTLYELAVLKKHIFPLLTAVEPEEACYDEVRKIVKILNYVVEADVDDEIPPTSLVREFIGGNTFYRK